MTPSLRAECITLKASERLYEMNVPIVALTGGIASGKSTFAHAFKKLGFCVISADELVQQIYESLDTKKWLESHKLPPKGPMLRDLVFKDTKIKKLVEDHIYEGLPQAFKNQAQQFKNKNLIIYDVPLLYERKLDPLVDQVIVVFVSTDVQKKRLSLRDQMTTEGIERILNAQIAMEEKKKKTPWVISNMEENKSPEENTDFKKILSSLFNL
jgi:dephospho-CoA kinase